MSPFWPPRDSRIRIDIHHHDDDSTASYVLQILRLRDQLEAKTAALQAALTKTKKG